VLNKTSSSSQSRFVFVDGLRGLAALAIVVFHIWWYEPEPYPALESAHWIFDEAFLKIRAGVQILLVISGFVIAYTLRKTWVTPREVLSFVARRLVRLVPTYWVAIGFVILVDAACRELWDLSSPIDGDLSLLRISSHMAFLQDVFGHDSLSAGMWTICIEMQFYIVAIIGWGVAQRAFPRPIADEPRPSAVAILTVFAPVAFISLFYWRALPSTSPWVIHFAWMFFLGMITWWTLDQTLPKSIFAVIVAIAVLELIFDAKWRYEIWIALMTASTTAPNAVEIESWRYENSIALATASAIFFAGDRQALHLWLNWRWLQYLGRISYSLYLIHFSVCHLLTTAAWKFFGNSPTSIQAVGILVASLIASLLAAHVLYILVEAPSARWAAKMKQTSA
jgi:peptidoglycan/LPS O-acetylase OafA/YrhL